MKIAFNLYNEENYTRFIVYCIENGIDTSECICPTDCRAKKSFFISWGTMTAYARDTHMLIKDGFIICQPFITTDEYGLYNLSAIVDCEYIQN